MYESAKVGLRATRENEGNKVVVYQQYPNKVFIRLNQKKYFPNARNFTPEELSSRVIDAMRLLHKILYSEDCWLVVLSKENFLQSKIDLVKFRNLYHYINDVNSNFDAIQATRFITDILPLLENVYNELEKLVEIEIKESVSIQDIKKIKFYFTTSKELIDNINMIIAGPCEFVNPKLYPHAPNNGELQKARELHLQCIYFREKMENKITLISLLLQEKLKKYNS